MLYFARFAVGADGNEPSPLIIDEPAGVERATARIEEETGQRPTTLQEVSPGVLFVEVKFADADGSSLEGSVIDSETNPANISPMGVILEPFEFFAEYLEAIDDLDLPAVLALTPTEPPAVEVADGG